MCRVFASAQEPGQPAVRFAIFNVSCPALWVAQVLPLHPSWDVPPFQAEQRVRDSARPDSSPLDGDRALPAGCLL